MELELSSVISGAMTLVLTHAAFTMRKMLSSIDRLNVQIAEVIKEIEFHDLRLGRLEKEH